MLEDHDDRWIAVNNAYVLGGTASAVEERWQAHLPMLLHPDPRRVAFLGLGTGISAGGALDHPFAELLALEIVPEVVQAAREDFAPWNHGVIDDPRVRVAVGDGRLALHFATVRDALAPGGLFCQWLPVYQLSEAQLAIAARTFVDVFPRSTLWRGNFLPDLATLALVGHAGERPLLATRVDTRVEALTPRLGAAEPLLQHPAGLWLHLVGPLGQGASWLSEARLNTDAHPWLELGGPRALDARGHFARGPLAEIYGDPHRARLESSPLAGLDATHRDWWAMGLALTRATAAPADSAPDRVLEVLRELPPDLRVALGVDER